MRRVRILTQFRNCFNHKVLSKFITLPGDGIDFDGRKWNKGRHLLTNLGRKWCPLFYFLPSNSIPSPGILLFSTVMAPENSSSSHYLQKGCGCWFKMNKKIVLPDRDLNPHPPASESNTLPTELCWTAWLRCYWFWLVSKIVNKCTVPEPTTRKAIIVG